MAPKKTNLFFLYARGPLSFSKHIQSFCSPSYFFFIQKLEIQKYSLFPFFIIWPSRPFSFITLRTMFNSVRRLAQKSVMTVTSWYRIPEHVIPTNIYYFKGIDRVELLAMSSCLPFFASSQYDYKYHFVCPFHVVAPYLFKSYFPGCTFICLFS